MITQKHFLAALGFAFIAAWIAFGFGNAILCGLGAAAGYLVASVLEGEIDLGELQQRVRGNDRGAQTPPTQPPPSAGSGPGRRVR